MVARFQGAIIAAGHGERLRAGGESLPKPLVDLGGEPLLLRQARALVECGADGVLVVINSETARLAEAAAIEFPPSMKVSVRDTRNSMETLFALGERLGPGYFLLTTVDAVMVSGELERFAQDASTMIESDSELAGVLAVTPWRGDRRPLFVSIGDDGSIKAFGDARASLVTAGAYFFSTRIFDLSARAREAGCGALREFLAHLVAQGLRLNTIEVAETIDIDEAADLAAARAMLERQQRPGDNKRVEERTLRSIK